MKLRFFFAIAVSGILLAGCAGTGALTREPPAPTRSEMQSLANETEPTRPYSRYIYKITEKDGIKKGKGYIDMFPMAQQDLYLIEQGSKLRVHANKTFMDNWNISFGDSDFLPFAGGILARGRLEIVPGFPRAIEVKPAWFPRDVSLGVDSKCNFLIESKNVRMSYIQKLVAFIDARSMLDRVRCELLGTFHDIPELQRLVRNAPEPGKYGPGQNYVLRLNWTDTFALVRIVRKDGR